MSKSSFANRAQFISFSLLSWGLPVIVLLGGIRSNATAQTITHVPLYTFHGDSDGDVFQSVSGAGDVNGDGRADLIVGASFDDNNGHWSGSARVLSGSDGSVLFTFDGDSRADRFGRSVSGAGDVNGDGIDDFIVNAVRGGTNDRGYARVFVSQVLGDCNQDGVVNFLDIRPFISVLSAGDFLGQADVNQDGDVNFQDISLFIRLLSRR